MTRFIIEHFIPNHERTGEPKVRARYGNVSSVVGILCNVTLFLTKLFLGFISGSVSIIADATNNLSDSASSVVSFIGFKLASRRPDKDHPYGHGRYEYLAGLVVSVLILFIGVEIFRTSLDKILNPGEVQYSVLTLAILFLSIGVKLWLLFFYRAMAKAIDSQTILATAADSRNDVITTAGVLLAALITKLSGVNLDGWVGLLIAIFIVINGIGLIRDTVNPLLGAAPEEELVKQVQAKILSYPGVLGTHDLRIHDYGPSRRFATVDVELDASLSGFEAHEITDRIERDIRMTDGIHMTVHYDPVLTEEHPDLLQHLDVREDARPEISAARVAAIQHWLNSEVRQIDSELSVHDVSINPTSGGQTELVFDCVKPDGFELGDEELVTAIRERVRRINPDYHCTIQVESFAPTQVEE